MLRIFIQDYEEANLRQIVALCEDCIGFNWETRIVARSCNLEDILAHVPDLDLPALFILEYAKSQELYLAVEKITRQNALHYMVLRLNSIKDAVSPKPPYLRPSGYLVAPYKKNVFEALLCGIYQDFSTTHNMYGGYFSLKMDGSVYRLPYNKILYFESNQKKVIARTAVQEYEFYDSLEDICSKAPSFFLRIHRGFCINTRLADAVSLGEKTVSMQDGSIVPFSRTYRDALIEAIAGISLGG